MNQSLVAKMAGAASMEPNKYVAALRSTVVPPEVSNEEFAAFLMVADQYRLNPLTREVFAFKSKSGAMQAIVSVDGWTKIINQHPQYDGMTTEERFDANGNVIGVTATIYRKDRVHPTVVTEWLKECRRDTAQWRQWPARMLRHKAVIQCARYAFGFAGIVDPDEADRIQSAQRAEVDMGSVEAEPAPQTKTESVARKVAAAATAIDVEPEPEPEPDVPEIRQQLVKKFEKRIAKCEYADQCDALVDEIDGDGSLWDSDKDGLMNKIDAKRKALAEEDMPI